MNSPPKKEIANLASRIALGSVQFGLDYGIANTRGKVSGWEVAAILDYAAEQGVTLLDTAAAYGDSEQVIGEYLKSSKNNFCVVSKLACDSDAASSLEDTLWRSLKRLHVERLYGVLLHRFDDYRENPARWMELSALKDKGMTQRIGFSLYSPLELEELFSEGVVFDMVQIPYSVFDRRFEKYFSALKERNIEIHARSIFLQGLAHLTPEDLPASLAGAREPLDLLARISKEHALSICAICLNYVLSHDEVDYAVIGVDSLTQLKENIQDLDCFDQVVGLLDNMRDVGVDQEDILLPYKWALN